MKSLVTTFLLFFFSHAVFASKSIVDNEIKDEITIWNMEALNITLTACQHYMTELTEKKLLLSNLSFPLAIQIKEALEELENFNETEEYQKVFEDYTVLLNKLPQIVVTLIWGSQAHLYNKYHTGEYLYAVYDSEADDDKRKVYTWLAGGRDPIGIWVFSTDDDGKSFSIKNVDRDEYLYAGDDSLAYDKSRRNVYTWRKETSDERRWVVEIQSDNEIMLKSKDRSEYFYAGYSSFIENGKRRKVFNWRESSPCDDTCVWVVSPEEGSIVV